jgi:hypothetical protein
MSKVVEKHFVTFLSPGTFVAEYSTKPIDSWDVKKAQKMATKIEERYKAVPYGFYFTTRSRGEDDLDSHETKRSHMYYLPHCRIETLAEVKRRNDPKESILLSNMECNGYDKIIVTTKGWKWTQPFGKDDVLIGAV